MIEKEILKALVVVSDISNRFNSLRTTYLSKNREISKLQPCARYLEQNREIQ